MKSFIKTYRPNANYTEVVNELESLKYHLSNYTFYHLF